MFLQCALLVFIAVAGMSTPGCGCACASYFMFAATAGSGTCWLAWEQIFRIEDARAIGIPGTADHCAFDPRYPVDSRPWIARTEDPQILQ